MTVYKYFLKLALKNKTTIIFFTLIFMINAVLTATGMGARSGSFESYKMEIGYKDEDDSDISRGLVDYLNKDNHVEKIDLNEEEIKEEVFLESYDGVIIIPKGFKDNFLLGGENLIKAYKDPNSAYSLPLNNLINKYLRYLKAMGEDYDLDSLGLVLDEEAEVIMIDKGVDLSSGERWFQNYFSFMTYILMYLIIYIFGRIILPLLEVNMGRRNFIASKDSFSFAKEIFLGQITVTIFIIAAYIGLALLINGQYIGDIPMLKYIIIMIVFSFSIIGFSFLVNSICKEQYQIFWIANVFSLGVSFISGVFVNQELLSNNTLKLARFFPQYYAISAINNRNIISILDMRFELAMLILFGITYFLLGLYFSRQNKYSYE